MAVTVVHDPLLGTDLTSRERVALRLARAVGGYVPVKLVVIGAETPQTIAVPEPCAVRVLPSLLRVSVADL